MEENKIELRSPKIDEIISTPPGFLLKSGSSLILLTITIILIFSTIIKIPEYIYADAIIEITGNNSHANLVVNLRTGEEFIVKKDQIVLVSIKGLSEFKYGNIVCKINDINMTIATCHLRLPVKTNYNILIPIEDNLRVKVKILVDKQTIFSKIMAPLKFFFKNSHSYI